MPHLGEFVRIAKTFGVEKRHSPVIEGPEGPSRFYYLQREPFRPFVILPDLPDDRVLNRDTVAAWCETLGLPPEDSGLPPT